MAFRITVLITLLYCLCLCPASAQEAVKRAIFADCEEAHKEFAVLTVEQQIELADFFARVVALSTQSPTAPDAFVPGPAVPAGGDTASLTAPKSSELVTGALWQGLDAKRELKAKRCALELLRGAGGLALHVLPTLAETYSSQPLSDEMSVGLEEAVADVAERAHKQGMTPTADQCKSLATNLFIERSLAARIVIQEFFSACFAHILNELPLQVHERPEVSAWLRQSNPDGALVMRIIIDNIHSVSPERLAQLMNVAALPEKTLITEFIDDFIKLSLEPKYAAIFTALLGKSCVALEGLTVDTTKQATISGLPGLLNPGILSASEVGCLINSAPSGAKRLATLLDKGATHDQQKFALEVMTSSYPGMQSDTRNELCSKSRERVIELHDDIAEQALSALEHCSESRSENTQIAFNILRVLQSLQDGARRENLFNRVVRLLEISGLGKDRSRFAPFLSPALKAPVPSHTVLRLAAQIPNLNPEVVKRALEVPPSPTSSAALQALASTKMFPKPSIQALIDLLRYPEIQGVGEGVLQTVGTAAALPLRKAISRASWSGRGSALSALLALKVATKAEKLEFANSLSSLEGCSFVMSHSRTMCQLLDPKGGEQAVRSHVASAIKRCINEMDQEQLSTVIDCAPDLILNASESILASVLSKGDEQRLSPVVSLLVREPMKSQSMTRLITVFLERGSQTTLQTILLHISSQGPATPEVLQAVRTIAERNQDSREIFLAALRVLARHPQSGYDWSSFIKDAIRECAPGIPKPDILEVVGQAPTEAVLAQVVPALESENPEKLVGGALVGAALGSRAIPIVSRLWHLRDTKHPLVRAVAVLALLQVNPLTPDLQTEVSGILVNRYFPIASLLPIRWAETVAVVDMNRSSFGDLRKARLELLLGAKPGL